MFFDERHFDFVRAVQLSFPGVVNFLKLIQKLKKKEENNNKKKQLCKSTYLLLYKKLLENKHNTKY